MRVRVIALSLFAILTAANPANAEQRVAFVVGNQAYTHAPKLENPVDDADAMASLLRGLGFDVVEGANLSHDGIAEKLLEFGKKARGADIAAFYYAGPGVAVADIDYLLPVDADIKSEMDVKLSAISLDDILDQAMGEAKLRLVFLDASRSNPLGSRKARIAAAISRGAAVITTSDSKPGQGTLIAFATGAGQVALDGEKGAHSPFTRALLAKLVLPGVEIQRAMNEVRAQVIMETNRRQIPWTYADPLGDVYLNPTPTPSSPGK